MRLMMFAFLLPLCLLPSLLPCSEDFKSRCVGVVSLAGAIGGSFIANNLWDTLKDYDAEWWLQNVDTILSKFVPLFKIFRPRRIEV